MDVDLEFSIGNIDMKFTKEGKIQVKAKEGIAVIESGGLPFSTTSTSFVDLDSLVLSQKNIDKTKQAEIIQKLDSLHDRITHGKRTDKKRWIIGIVIGAVIAIVGLLL